MVPSLVVVVSALLMFVHQSTSLVVPDGCAGCSIDPLTQKPTPLTIVYRSGESTASGAWPTDTILFDTFSTQWNVSIIVRRPDAERLRYVWPQLMSTGFVDAVLWQGYGAMGGNAANLTSLAIEEDWKNRYPKSLLDLSTDSNGDIRSLPDRYSFWGIWYRKSQFASLNLTAPKTWTEFMGVCEVFKKNGTIPVAIGLVELWQQQLWFQYLSLRLGGLTWWKQLIAGQIDFHNDQVMNQTWYLLDDMISKGYFSPLPIARPMTGSQSVAYWASGKAGMHFYTGTAYRTAKSDPDVDFFPFPSVNPNLPASEAAEAVSISFWIVNSRGYQMPLAKEWVRYASSLNYSMNLLFAVTGGGPALSAARAQISVVPFQRGFALLDASPLVNMMDVDIPTYTIVSKPLMYQFFNRTLSVDGLMLGLERTRQEVLLQTTVAPRLVANDDTILDSNTVTLSTSTQNATIYYSIVGTGSLAESSSNYYPYSSPITLPSGTYRVRCYARRELLKDSPVVEYIVTVLADIYDQPPLVLPVFYAVTAILLAIAAVFAFGVWKYRETSVIKASSPLFCALMILGCSFVYVAVYMILKNPPTDGLCVAVPYLGHLGFGLVFGSLGAKTWRLVKIFDQRKMEVMKISNRQLLLYVSVYCGAALLYLILWAAIDPPTPTPIMDSNRIYSVCQSKHDAWGWVIIVLEAVTLLLGCSWAFRARNNPQLFNESSWIAASIYNCTLLGGLILLLYRAGLVTRPDSIILLQAIGLLIVTAATKFLIFVPKFYLLWTYTDDELAKGVPRSDRYSLPGGNNSGLDRGRDTAVVAPVLSDRMGGTVVVASARHSPIMCRSMTGSNNSGVGASTPTGASAAAAAGAVTERIMPAPASSRHLTTSGGGTLTSAATTSGGTLSPVGSGVLSSASSSPQPTDAPLLGRVDRKVSDLH